MLGECEVIAFTQTTVPERAKVFYRDVLGLKLEEENPFALVFAAGGTMVRVQKVRAFSPLPCTALGWRVGDIVSLVRELSTRGVVFERFAGMPQDEAGVWTSPDGARIAWFKDPDGNVLSLTQWVDG